jgi:tetratricopeptide (TPR) repeat protein
MKHKFRYILLTVAVCLTLAGQSSAQDLKLIELRKNFAQRYLQPDAHFALAKYYIEKGNFVQAFFILEYARRYRFEEKDFDTEFFKFFGDPMPEPPDEAKDLFKRASDLASQQKYDEAETYFQKANARYDRSFFINAWIGRFFYKAKADGSKALPFYFKAYFLYPHAYETEYVESRIRMICSAEADESYKNSLKIGKSLPELARDANPIIVGKTVQEMAKNWKREYLSVLIDVMDNDDSINRWGAFVTLHKFAGPELDRMVDEFSSGSDLRKRGLAAYAIVERKGDDKFQILKKMLADPAELVRFDAISALVLSGGVTGKQILTEHERVEKQPRLKTLIIKALRGKPE